MNEDGPGQGLVTLVVILIFFATALLFGVWLRIVLLIAGVHIP